MLSMKENIEKSSPSLPLGNPDHEKPCWYWDKEDLAHTPSRLEGLEPVTEARYRREGARFIFDVGNRLGLLYNTLATGIIYFHRFYMFNSFKQFPRHMTGACCLFLAGKVEETPKRCSDIIKTSRSLLTDLQFRQFGDDPKKEVIVMEKIILQTIKFDLQVEHPYKFLLKYAKKLKGDKKKIQKLVQTAWTFINDSLSTTLSLQWEPEIIAVAVMYLAGRMRKCEIQELTSKPKDKIWWEQFVEDLEVDLIEDICHQILDLYSPEKQQMPHHPHHNPPLLQTQQKNQEESQQPSLQTQQASLHVKPEKNTIMPTNPPQPMKRPATTSSKGENKSREVAEKSTTGPVPKNISTVYPTENSTPAKMLKLSPAHQPMLPVHPPTKCKSPLVTTVPVEADQTDDAGEISEIQIPRLSQYGPVDQPLSFALCPPPHPTNNDISKMPIVNTCLSDKEYQSLQSMPTIDGPFYEPLPLSYTPFHQNLLYPPHVYLAYPPPPGPPHSIFWPPNIPPPNLGYPPPPTYNIHLPPPGMPPTYVVAQHPTSETPVDLPGGLPQVSPLMPPTDMPPLGGMGCSAWM